MALTSIANRLTPSVPLEITFGAQPVTTGRKMTTLFAHMAEAGSTAEDYEVYQVVNVADPALAKAEVEALAGEDSEAALMTEAFVKANAFAGSSNFPAFQLVLLPFGETAFGADNEALTAVKFERNDMLVSPYPAGNAAARGALSDFAALISGPDRDLQGQFGTFVTVGSIDPLATAVDYNIVNKQVIVAYLPDSSDEPAQGPEIIAAAHAGRMMSSSFPYTPLQGVAIGGLKAPAKKADWIDINPQGASEQALLAGLSPLTIQPGNVVGFIRSRTSWTLMADGVTPVTSYFDWQDLAVLNDFRETVYYITQQPPFANNPGGTKASRTNAALLKDEILREAYRFETEGAFQYVKELAAQFVVEVSQTSRGRFDFKIPVDVIPGLIVIAGNIQAVSFTA